MEKEEMTYKLPDGASSKTIKENIGIISSAPTRAFYGKNQINI